MKSLFHIKLENKKFIFILLLCFSLFQFSFAGEQKDTVVVLQKKGRDRRYHKSCKGENVFMLCAFRKHGLTVLSEQVGIVFYPDLYNRRFSEGASLLTFLISLKK